MTGRTPDDRGERSRDGDDLAEIPVAGMRVTVARPTGSAPHPGLVVLHEGSGVTDDLRRITRHLAAMGYVAAAPDLYSGGFKPLCIARTVRDAFVDPSRRGTTDRIERIRAWMAELPEVNGARIGVIGFCMGGGFAVVAAARSPFAAAAVNYGRVPRDPTLLTGSCPVVANYGADDRLVPADTPARYEAALRSQGVPIDVEVFEGVGHSFMNQEPALVQRLGLAYDGPSAARAWRRIDRFFAEHLGAPGPEAPDEETATDGTTADG